MSVETTFKITVIIENDRRRHIRTRVYSGGFSNGCNHINNIPGTAKYMGEELLKSINRSPSELFLDKSVKTVDTESGIIVDMLKGI